MFNLWSPMAMYTVALVSGTLAFRVGRRYPPSCPSKGVRSAPKGSADLGPHGKAVTTQAAFGGHRRQRIAPRLERR